MKRPAGTAGLALLLASLAWGASPRAADPVAPPDPARVAPAVAPTPSLPVGFTTAVSPTTISQFVHVVARDIDKDGDLDVIATDGTLELLVWENDGAGHFRRKAAGHGSTFEPLPPERTIHEDSGGCHAGIQSGGGRSLQVDRVASVISVAPSRQGPATASVAINAPDLSVRIPRGPPSVLAL